MAASEIDIGFATAATQSRALKEKKVSQLQALEVRKECAIMLAIIVSQDLKKSPLQCNFARKLASLDTRIMVSKPESAVKMFEQVLNRLIEEKWKTSQQGDTGLSAESSSLKPRSITIPNLLHNVLPKKDWTGF